MYEVKNDILNILHPGEMCSLSINGRRIKVCNMVNTEVKIDFADDRCLLVSMQDKTECMLIQKKVVVNKFAEPLLVIVIDDLPDRYNYVSAETLYLIVEIDNESVKLRSERVNPNVIGNHFL